MSRQLLLLGAAWAAYFTIHSLLASLKVKYWVAARRPGLLPFYRLSFNVVALLLLLPPLYLTFSAGGEPLWAWRGPMAFVANALALLAVGLFWFSLRYYDSGEFLGLRQIGRREDGVEDQERLRISPLHRYVRHPWYSLALLVVWTRDMPPAMLLTSLCVTLYFLLGSRLEEHKLLIYHGSVYRDYRARVPAIIPRPWRYLSREEAAALERRAREG